MLILKMVYIWKKNHFQKSSDFKSCSFFKNSLDLKIIPFCKGNKDEKSKKENIKKGEKIKIILWF